MKKRILYIWDADYPWDVRVEKICMTLKKNEHEVHIAARNLKKLHEYENINGLHIHRLKKWENEKINYTLSFPVFFSPVWKRFLDSIIHNKGINLIIVRDLPMAIAGIWAGKRNKIPVIFDMAEDYLAMIWDIWRSKKFKGLNYIVRNPYLAKLVEKYAFNNTDHILVVVDEAKGVVLRGGGNIKKVTIIGNTPSLELFSNLETPMDNTFEYIKERFSVIYTGGIQMGRGLQDVIDAIPEIVKKIPEFLFVVVGDGYATEQLQKKIQAKNLQDHVFWAGWVEHQKVYDYINACKVGIIPHVVSDHVNTTIPNKIFDYMVLGLPVIATNSFPMKRILDEERCGLTFESGNPSDLARAIIGIYNNNNEYGQNAINAIKKKYNWENEETKLLQVIEKVG